MPQETKRPQDNHINRISAFAKTLLDDEPLDGDSTAHLADVFRFHLDSLNGNLSKEEETRIRRSLGIPE